MTKSNAPSHRNQPTKHPRGNKNGSGVPTLPPLIAVPTATADTPQRNITDTKPPNRTTFFIIGVSPRKHSRENLFPLYVANLTGFATGKGDLQVRPLSHENTISISPHCQCCLWPDRHHNVYERGIVGSLLLFEARFVFQMTCRKRKNDWSCN